MNVTLKYLRYADAVARHGSISKAAQQLFVSQSGVASALDTLEKVLGVRIFLRQRAKGMGLTPTGREIISHARRILDEIVPPRLVIAHPARLGSPAFVGAFTALCKLHIGEDISPCAVYSHTG